jgi:hypothetical protein
MPSFAEALTMADRRFRTETSAMLDKGICTASVGGALRKSAMIFNNSSWCLPLRDFLRLLTGTLR